MNIVYIILTIFGVTYVYHYNNSNRSHVNREEPLIITDYLNNGQADLARELSRVEPFLGNIESYAGFFRVTDDCVRNMYFWYFPAQNGNTSAPILVWLQGGPGGASIYGLFVENGPYYFDSNDELHIRTHSWTQEYSVIFIDNPVGTGFSFSDIDCYVTNEDQVGLYLALTMRQFYQLFPHLRANQLYITGESYAGKYVPAMVSEIIRMNENNPTPMNLVGMAIGDGLCDPYNMVDFGTYMNRIGLIFDNQIVHFDRLRDLARQSIENGEFNDARIYFNTMFELFGNLTGLHDVYNYYIDRDDPYQNYIDFVNLNSQKLNAGNQGFYDDVDLVSQILNEDHMKTVSPLVQNIINAGYKSLFFSGQFDVIVPYQMTSSFLRHLNWNGKEDFVRAPQQIWHSRSCPERVNGYVRSAGNVMQIIVRNSGHMVPKDQPESALEMLRIFIHEF